MRRRYASQHCPIKTQSVGDLKGKFRASQLEFATTSRFMAIDASPGLTS
jgi:hypothetical protein